jgi:predicted nucleotide-binding protein
MTRPRRQPDPPREKLRLDQPRSTVEERLRAQIEKGLALVDREIASTESYEAWKADRDRWARLTEEILSRAYNTEDPKDEFGRALNPPFISFGGYDSVAEQIIESKADLSSALNVLKSLVERLEILDELTTSNETPAVSTRVTGSGVFLVHGHDDAAKQTVARFIEKVTKPGVTILEEQADRGRTLIEKFEQHAAEMGYAVVLITGDDEGRKIGSGDEFSPRARQNVILELGFFIGALGRGRVAMVYTPGVELPSDIAGVLYLPLESGGAWKIKLAREMRDAGVPVDADAVLAS